MAVYAFEIIQGSNSPVTVTYPEDVSASIDLHVGIYDRSGNELMHWSKDAVTINGMVVSCPITQGESNDCPVGDVFLETKRTDSNGKVHLYEKVPGRIIGRFDHHVIVEEVL